MEIQQSSQLSHAKLLLIMLILAIIFLILYFLYYPDLFSIGDERRYINQALAFSNGKTTFEYFDLSTWKSFKEIPGTVSPGTALLLTPFLLLGGWKALFLLPFISHLIVTLLIVLILKHEKLNPLFAAAYLFYPIALIMSRFIMSDMVNLMFVTISVYIFWTKHHNPANLFWAGLFAGLSILIRPTNVIFFMPFFSFHILRQHPGWIHLLLGIIIGCLPRLLVYGIIFSNPFYLFEGKPLGTGYFGFQHLLVNLIFYITTLTIGLYGMPLALIFYRGRLRWEMLSSSIAILLLYSSFSYGPGYSAFYKSVVITNRYLLPIVPLTIVAAASVISEKLINIKEQFKRYGRIIGLTFLVILGIATFNSHHIYLRQHSKLREAIYANTMEDSIIIHDVAVSKYFFPFWGIRHNYVWMGVSDFDILNAIEHDIPIYTVFLFRSDRKWHNQCTSEFISSLESVCTLESVAKVNIKGEILEINRITFCAEPLPPFNNENCLKGAAPRPSLFGG